MTALPLDAIPPSGLSVSILGAPPADAYFGLDGEPAIAEGRELQIGIDPAQVHLFDSAGQAVGAAA